jgi:hypothetical protein
VTDLTLEIQGQPDETGVIETPSGGTILLTPPVSDSYWKYRVQLSDTQSIIGFPKFSTIGIGFAVENDWNTNLPYTQDAEKIFNHIDHNKGDDNITDEDCITAIKLIQEAATDAKAAS